jgi:hypothetical protein
MDRVLRAADAVEPDLGDENHSLGVCCRVVGFAELLALSFA